MLVVLGGAMKTVFFGGAMVVAAFLAGCAPRIASYNDWSDLSGQVVGNRPSDTQEVLPGSIDGKRVTAISVVRVFNDDGWLALCGALLVAAPTQSLLDNQVADYYRGVRSRLILGDYSISPRFMKLHTKILASGIIDERTVGGRGLAGNCVRTKQQWRDDFTRASHLELIRTRTR